MARARSPKHRLAVDIGGTFVDAVLFDAASGEVRLEKDFTTPGAVAEGVKAAVGRLNVPAAELDSFIHGTTLGLNTVLQRAGARCAILTNTGFEDIFEMGRYARDKAQMYSLTYDVDPPLVPKRLRRGIACRMNAEGEELEPLDEDAVKLQTADLIERHDIETIAVCYLHAYKNPAHEQRTAEIIAREWPDFSVSISSDIIREYREYERTATTVVNAYIRPIFDRYIAELEGMLKDQDFGGAFYITRSGGGALAAAQAAKTPVHTLFSGPAGGLIGAARLAELLDMPDLIAVDMGGTSTDTCVIQGGLPALKYEAALERTPLMIPTYDISTIGAGGGSIAWVDSGLLKVGPRSAGAVPGPICYGRGGKEPTLTDAALALGYVNPERFLGGALSLQQDDALEGLKKKVAGPLDIAVTEAARGIFDVLLAKSMSAIREITVEKGLDPREFAMLAYGGAGPMFVPLLGREADARAVLIPQAPSVFSAWGMLTTDLVQEYAQTMVGLLEDIGLADIRTVAAKLGKQAAEDLKNGGFPANRQAFETEVSLRYFGQEHALEVPLKKRDTGQALRARFDMAHAQRYGHAMDDPMQLVHVRVRGIGSTQRPSLKKISNRQGAASGPSSSRNAYCFARRSMTRFTVHERDSLRAGDQINGPAIIEEETTTIILHSDQIARTDQYGHLLITRDSAT